MNSLRHLLGLIAFAAFAASTFAAPQTEYWTYFGTYTGKKSKGIYAAHFDTRTGKLGEPILAGEMTNPSFLAVHPNQRFLYAVGEFGGAQGRKAGSVAAFAIDVQTGKLTMINQQSSGGPGPCHVYVDPSGRCVLAANYSGGSVIAIPVREDGSLGEAETFIQHTGSSVVKGRQDEPHGHCMITDPSNRFALACDLGLDKVMIYKFDPAKATLVANAPAFGSTKAGAGPRHIAFHPNGRYAYVIDELDCTITSFSWDGDRGALAAFQSVSTLPGEKEKSFSTAEIQVHPSGKFVYGSNRGHDSISVFSVDAATGSLSRIQTGSSQGKMPRHFALDPSARYLIAENQNSDNVVVFSVDPSSGKIAPTGDKIEVGSPVCAVFVPVK